MFKIQPLRRKARYIYEENIYFSTRQICQMLGVSRSCLSKQLKKIIDIPGCEEELFSPSRFDRPNSEGNRKIKHYNIQTIVGLAFRINNEACRYFLYLYHRALWGFHIRLVGANYYVPSIIGKEEFERLVRSYMPPLGLDYED